MGSFRNLDMSSMPSAKQPCRRRRRRRQLPSRIASKLSAPPDRDVPIPRSRPRCIRAPRRRRAAALLEQRVVELVVVELLFVVVVVVFVVLFFFDALVVVVVVKLFTVVRRTAPQHGHRLQADGRRLGLLASVLVQLRSDFWQQSAGAGRPDRGDGDAAGAAADDELAGRGGLETDPAGERGLRDARRGPRRGRLGAREIINLSLARGFRVPHRGVRGEELFESPAGSEFPVGPRVASLADGADPGS